jgi:hypothetical protein
MEFMNAGFLEDQALDLNNELSGDAPDAATRLMRI